MERKVAFFDMDGTLVAPLFKDKSGKMVVGFPEAEWIEFCNERKGAAYDDCLPMYNIINCAKQLIAKGYVVEILTVTLSDGENLAKRHWVDNNPEYKSIFSDVICVPDEHSKIEYITDYLHRNNISPHNCILVEDSFSTVLKAIPLGINAIHISHILTTFI